MYGKATETAIAAMSRLAEVYDGGETRLSAKDIADERSLQGPFVAKVLHALSQAGLVVGTRGPGGGFYLAKHPREILIHDVYRLFDHDEETDNCPFGGGVCGVGDKCPLHDLLVDVQRAREVILYDTSFEVFRVAYQEHGLRPAKRRKGKKKKTKKRESFRARSMRRRRL